MANCCLSKAQNDVQAAFAQLANLMGLREQKTYRLVEQPLAAGGWRPIFRSLFSKPSKPGPTCSACGTRRKRPSSSPGRERALRYPHLCRGQRRPGSHWRYCAGGQLCCGRSGADPAALHRRPLSARQQEAELRARAADESLRDLENNVVRDVRISWLSAQNAFDRLRITGQLLDNAKQSYELAQARYTNGISSIVEFNQAQLNLLSAQIAYADTQYEYLLRRSALNYQTGSLR